MAEWAEEPLAGSGWRARPVWRALRWGTRIGALISGARIRCPTIRRSPKGAKRLRKVPCGATPAREAEHYSRRISCQARSSEARRTQRERQATARWARSRATFLDRSLARGP